MSLFPRFSTHPSHSHYSSPEFPPIFRLLSNLDVPTPSSTSTIRSFAPKFDVREAKEAYYLDGELPGIAQKEIDIEFTDPQTMVVKGRVEREYASDIQPEGPEGKGKKVQDGEKGVTKKGEEEEEEEGGRHSYWVSERSVGEFHRTFTFPSRVDNEAVKAKLKDGILSVTIPKVVGKGGKRITVE
jgi:HSP20 family molecular chaperone IbpA